MDSDHLRYLLYSVVFVVGMFLAGFIALRMGDGSLLGFVRDRLMSSSASELPDIVASVPAASGPFVEGSSLALAGTIANAGRGATPEFQNVFQVDLQNRSGVFLSSDAAVAAMPLGMHMQGGALQPLNGLWGHVPVGTHLVRLCADVTRRVAEANEENNCSPPVSVTVVSREN